MLESSFPPPIVIMHFVTSEKRTTPLFLVPYKGQKTHPQLVPCREAPPYKGQRIHPQLVPCREAPLYKGQRTHPLVERLHCNMCFMS